ncbi:MAG: transposase [Rhodothalassiaceae bacterium]|nr:MAG: transposase [Rhodothalassiaceae bacterium]
MPNADVVTITRDRPDEIIEAVKAEIARSGATQAQVAREAGVSPTTLTQLLSGTYAADPSRMTARLAQWLARRREQQSRPAMPAAPAWCETETASRIMAALAYAHMAGDIALIYGAAGVGKTMTARAYQARYPQVWIATMSPATSGVATALEEVCLALGLREPPQSAARMMREIVSRTRDTGGLLIIDEAQHLGHAALDALRAIHDEAGIGLALMGNDLVYTRMTGGTRAAWLDRLWSRIGRRLRIGGTTPSDIKALASAWGLQDDAAHKRLARICRGPGGLRSAVKCLRLAQLMADGRQETLADAHIREAWRDLTGEAA